jgi:GT2 family glycosyltransferase
LAGVAGYRRDVNLRNGRVVSERDEYRDPQDRPFEVKAFGGAALYRRSALEQVGGFNPYIISDEEPELCMRLRHTGYKLMCLPVLMCKNYTVTVNSWAYYARRLRLGLLLGRGQVLRYHLKTGMLTTALRERASDLFVLAAALFSLSLALWTLFFRRVRLLLSWVTVAGGVLGLYSLKKRSVKQTLMSLLGRLAIAYGIGRGFLIPPKSPADYPTQAEIVK